ncbi:MAG: ribonuclease D [Panacagrimonas sp.]
MPTQLVDTQDVLTEFLQRWKGAPFLALDTEFIREQTYYPQLCLVQVGDLHDAACLDPLAAGIDLQPLLDRLADPATTYVFHAAGQDLEIFVRLAGRCPAPLFDTQIAAALLGYGEQLGYAGLIEKLVGVRLDKSLSRTNWARRPLSAAELAYAGDDVRHLADVYPRLLAELEEKGRLAWLREDCEAMTDPARYRPAPENEWKRLKGLARMNAPAQHVAARLAAWRETIAEQRDRPRRWILPDEAIYLLAERRPQSLRQLGDLQALPPKSLDRHGEALLGLIEQGAATDALPLLVDARADDAEKQRLKRLLDRARAIATELGIPASLLAPRADIEALAAQGEKAPVALLRGWRREVAGEELLGLV